MALWTKTPYRNWHKKIIMVVLLLSTCSVRNRPGDLLDFSRLLFCVIIIFMFSLILIWTIWNFIYIFVNLFCSILIVLEVYETREQMLDNILSQTKEILCSHFGIKTNRFIDINKKWLAVTRFTFVHFADPTKIPFKMHHTHTHFIMKN